MPTRQQTEGNQKPLDNEPMPAIDDDVDVAAPAPAPVARAEDAGEGEPLPPRRRGDEGRDAITQRYREIQAEEREERGKEPPDEGGELGAEPEEGRASPGLPDSEAGDDPELELLVYGNRHKLKRSELVKAYDLEGLSDEHIISVAQKQMAADQRLAEAKDAADQQLTRGTQRLNGAGEDGHGAPADQHGEPRPDDADGLAPEDRPPRDPDQGLNEEKLDEIVQRVQFGDADEAKQALRDFAGVIRTSIPGASPEEVLNQFEQRLAQKQHQTEIYNALTKFGEENPDLIGDRHLVTVGLDLAADEMLADLKGIGIPDDQLAPFKGDRQAIAAAHRAVRLQGHKVRTVDEVLADAADTLRTKFHIPRPGPGTSSSQPHPASPPGQTRERLHRKDLAPQQPRHGGVRGGAAPVARPKTALEIINEKRKAQGFHTV